MLHKVEPATSPAVVVPSLRVVYVPVAKAASTSVKMALWHATPEGQRRPVHPWHIHGAPFLTVRPGGERPGGRGGDRDWDRGLAGERAYRGLLDGSWVLSDNRDINPIRGAGSAPVVRYTCFTVVKHPLARLYSVWADKFGHPERFKDLSQHGAVLRMGMAFPEFVQALRGVDLPLANEHLRPQVDLLRPYTSLGGVYEPAVLRCESLTRDWEELTLEHRSHTGLELPALGRYNESGVSAPPVERRHRDGGPLPTWRDAYDPVSLATALGLYRADLEGLGYGTDPLKGGA